MKRLLEYILEELDLRNLTYMIDRWFENYPDQLSQFEEILVKCKQDKVVNPKNLEKYIKGTFLETQLEDFVRFINNEVKVDPNTNYIYELKIILTQLIK